MSAINPIRDMQAPSDVGLFMKVGNRSQFFSISKKEIEAGGFKPFFQSALQKTAGQAGIIGKGLVPYEATFIAVKGPKGRVFSKTIEGFVVPPSSNPVQKKCAEKNFEIDQMLHNHYRVVDNKPYFKDRANIVNAMKHHKTHAERERKYASAEDKKYYDQLIEKIDAKIKMVRQGGASLKCALGPRLYNSLLDEEPTRALRSKRAPSDAVIYRKLAQSGLLTKGVGQKLTSEMKQQLLKAAGIHSEIGKLLAD